MFEKATRTKLRFETPKGLLTVEDLWDLPLTGNGTNLDKIAVGLNRQIREEGNESFVTPRQSASEVLQLKFDVVKHVIDVKQAENAATKAATDKKAKKAHLLEIMERKQNAELESTSLEELQKMVAEL